MQCIFAICVVSLSVNWLCTVQLSTHREIITLLKWFTVLQSMNGKDYWANVKRLDALSFNVIKYV